MKQRNSPPSLRMTLILVLSIVIIVHLILEKGVEMVFEQPSRIERQQIESARQLIDRVRASSDLQSAKQFIGVQRTDPNVELLALLDGQGRVIHSSQSSTGAGPAGAVTGELDSDTYRKAVSRQQVLIEKSASGESIHLYAPFSVSSGVDQPGQTTGAGLYLHYDLARAQRNALRETFAPANWLGETVVLILSAGLILLLLNHWITEPLRRVGRSINRVIRGDVAVLSEYRGSGEIARLGLGVESISREMDASKSAVKQAGLELEKRVDQRTRHLSQEIRYRRNLERALRIHERQMQIVFNTVSEGIALWDTQGNLVYANPGFRRLLGMSKSETGFEFESKRVKLVDEHGEPLSPDAFPITETLSDLQPRENVIIGIDHPNTPRSWLNINAVPVTESQENTVTGIVSSVSDITQLKYHENQLEQMAHFDALTGLPNRRLLHDRMHQLVEKSRRSGRILAVCLLDLDGFKQVNDKYGHKAGDGLLVEAAGRFVNCVRAGDTVARLGGDEFVVLLTDIEEETECEPVLERILSSLSSPYTVSGNVETGISVSIGITLYPADNSDPDTLLRHADQAMYSAKKSGKNRYQWFDPGLEQRLMARNDMLKDLARAVSEREFVLHYQPKIDCRDGSVVGAEALLRWQHPVLGMLQPAQFIPLVEEHDIALDIGRQAIESVLEQAHAWSRQGYQVPVSVNIFVRQLQQPDFLSQLEQLLNRFTPEERVPLDLEIVECAALQRIRDFPALVHRCETRGVSFSLDDFGTGYSTLDHLRRIPAQTVKIDRSFVSDLLTNDEDRILIEAAIGLGRAFGRKIVAGGVESEEQLRWLRSAGCDQVQGFLFASPMAPSEFLTWLRQYQPDAGWGES